MSIREELTYRAQTTQVDCTRLSGVADHIVWTFCNIHEHAGFLATKDRSFFLLLIVEAL